MTLEEKIRGALARGYCTPENEKKELDSTLIDAMVKEILSIPIEPLVMQKIAETNKIALAIAESVTPKLTEQEQAFFIAGFVECVKLNSNFSV